MSMCHRYGLLASLVVLLLPLSACSWMRCVVGDPDFEATLELPEGAEEDEIGAALSKRLSAQGGRLCEWRVEGRTATFSACLSEATQELVVQSLAPGELELAEVLDAEIVERMRPYFGHTKKAPLGIVLTSGGLPGQIWATIDCPARPYCLEFLAPHTPEGAHWAFEQTQGSPSALRPTRTRWKAYPLAAPAVEGNCVAGARFRPDNSAGSPSVAVNLTEKCGKRLEEVTARLVHRRLAIVIDGIVYAAPVVQERIPHGAFQVSLSNARSDETARGRTLAAVLSAGPLPGGIELVDFAPQ